MSLNPKTAPEKVIWASSPELKHEELPCVGLHSDAFYRPMQIQGDWMEYQGSVLAIDPSGRGDNETSYCCAKMLNGNVFITDAGGLVGGYTDKTLQSIATLRNNKKQILSWSRKTMEEVCLPNFYFLLSQNLSSHYRRNKTSRS